MEKGKRILTAKVTYKEHNTENPLKVHKKEATLDLIFFVKNTTIRKPTFYIYSAYFPLFFLSLILKVNPRYNLTDLVDYSS